MRKTLVYLLFFVLALYIVGSVLDVYFRRDYADMHTTITARRDSLMKVNKALLESVKVPFTGQQAQLLTSIDNCYRLIDSCRAWVQVAQPGEKDYERVTRIMLAEGQGEKLRLQLVNIYQQMQALPNPPTTELGQQAHDTPYEDLLDSGIRKGYLNPEWDDQFFTSIPSHMTLITFTRYQEDCQQTKNQLLRHWERAGE